MNWHTLSIKGLLCLRLQINLKEFYFYRVMYDSKLVAQLYSFLNKCSLLIYFLLYFSTFSSAQDSLHISDLVREDFYISLNDGQEYQASLIGYSESSLDLLYGEDRFSIAKTEINYLYRKGKQKIVTFPQYSWLFPTGFKPSPLEYRNDFGVLNRLTFPIIGNLSATIGGIFLLGEYDNLFMSTLKYTIPFDEFSISPNLNFIVWARGESMVVPMVSVSFGQEDEYFNFGAGYAQLSDSGREESFYATSFGGYKRVKEKLGITNENIFIFEDGELFILTTGILEFDIRSTKLGIGVAAAFVVDDLEFVAFPNVTFAYRKSKRRIKQIIGFH